MKEPDNKAVIPGEFHSDQKHSESETNRRDDDYDREVREGAGVVHTRESDIPEPSTPSTSTRDQNDRLINTGAYNAQ